MIWCCCARIKPPLILSLGYCWVGRVRCCRVSTPQCLPLTPPTSLCCRKFSQFTSWGPCTCPACRDIIGLHLVRCILHMNCPLSAHGWPDSSSILPTVTRLGTTFGYMARFHTMLIWILGEYCQNKRTKISSYHWHLEESQVYDREPRAEKPVVVGWWWQKRSLRDQVCK